MTAQLAAEGRITEPSFERRSAPALFWTRTIGPPTRLSEEPEDWSRWTISYVSAPRATDFAFSVTSYFEPTESITYVVEPKLSRVPENQIATFTLDSDSDDELVFSDAAGVAYGVGRTFKDAVEDWYVAATEISAELRSSPMLHARLTRSLGFLDRVLGPGG